MYFYLVIPLGGRLCIACLCLFVGLGNLFQGLAVLFNQYIKLIHILLIAVERIVQFREGSLKIAEKSGCPVVPVAITGTPAIFENHIPFVRPAHVTIEYGRPFGVKELPPESRKRPGAYTRDVIIGMLEKEQTAS